MVGDSRTTALDGRLKASVPYDGAGYLQSVTGSLTRTVSFTNDAIGRALSQQFPDRRTASFTYDGNSNLRA